MRKLVPWAGACVALTLALGACSDPSLEPADDATQDGEVSWAEPTADLDGVTLTIWASQSSSTTAEMVKGAFEEATGATVEILVIRDPYEQGIQTKVATGDMPDLAFWQSTESMLTAINATTNLQPLDGAPWIEELSPELRDITGTLDGVRYAALITSPSVMGVYYNTQVFAEHGVTGTPGSFEELIDLARDLKADGVTPFFEAGGARWPTQWWVQVQLADAARDGLWDRVNAGEETFSDETIMGAVETYESLIDEGLFNDTYASATVPDQVDAVLDGSAAMAIQVNSYFGQMQSKMDTAGLDETIGFFPISPSGNISTFIPDQSNTLIAFRTGDETREAAARQLLAFWMGPFYEDFIDKRGTVSLKPEVESPAAVPQALRDAHASLSDTVGSMQALAVANPDLYINLADMLSGTMTAEDVGKATQEQFAQLARAAGTPGF